MTTKRRSLTVWIRQNRREIDAAPELLKTMKALGLIVNCVLGELRVQDRIRTVLPHLNASELIQQAAVLAGQIEGVDDGA